MGVLDQFFKEASDNNLTRAIISEPEAWMGILYCCMAIDHSIKDSELESLTRLVKSKELFWEVDLIRIYEKTSESYSSIGGQKLVDLCAPVVSSEYQKTVFALSTEIVLSDGILKKEELEILEYIGKKLKLEDNELKKIVEVLLVRNKGNLKLS